MLLSRSKLTASVVTLALSLTPSLGSAADKVNSIYDFYLGGIKAGELSIDATFSGKKYKAQSVLKTAGVVGFVYKAAFEAKTVGKRDGTSLVPRRFSADSRMKKKEQSVEMVYRNNAPARVSAEPAFQPKPWEIDPTEQGGTLDPISAALTALAPAPVGEICNTSVEVFDGRRRYAIDLGAPVKDGKRIKCPAVYRRIAGFKPKMMKKRPSFPFNIWYQERPDGKAEVVRGAGSSMFGLAVILLRQPG